MNIRQEILSALEQLSDEQLTALLPFILTLQNSQPKACSSSASQAYHDWLSAEHDIYNEIFADELATRSR